MHLLDGTVEELRSQTESDELADRLSRRYTEVYHRPVGHQEYSSWVQSLRAFLEAASDAGLDDRVVFLEYEMPLCSKRCDVLLVGEDRRGEPCALIIELKQWQDVRPSNVLDCVSVAGRDLLHPSVQVGHYVEYLKYFQASATEHGVSIRGCAFLHNLDSAGSISSLRKTQLDPPEFASTYPVYAAPEEAEFSAYLYSCVGLGDSEGAAESFRRPRYRPASVLLDHAAAAIQSNFEWHLLDEQRVAYSTITAAAEKSRSDGKRRVILVRGGPGTGKSIIALQLLAHCAKRHWPVAHATGSRAFRKVMAEITKKHAKALLKSMHGDIPMIDMPVENLFTTPSSIAKLADGVGTDVLDLVVIDEAHRLWDFRRDFFGNQVSDVPMIQELMSVSPVLSFFLDDEQGVRPNEIGTVDFIRKSAEEADVEVTLIDLEAQFRCGGCTDYTRWIDSVLSYGPPAPVNWNASDRYEFRVMDSVSSMASALRNRMEEGYRCRMAAGFCWPWSYPRNDGSLVNDVSDPRFGGWSAPWNERDKNVTRQVMMYYHWATDNKYFDQVGCVYSAQGFEFDYVGIIFGEDLVSRDDEWVAQMTKNYDKGLKKKLDPQDASGLLRNIYRVLLTRGVRGCFVYFLDQETKRTFQKALGNI